MHSYHRLEVWWEAASLQESLKRLQDTSSVYSSHKEKMMTIENPRHFDGGSEECKTSLIFYNLHVRQFMQFPCFWYNSLLFFYLFLGIPSSLGLTVSTSRKRKQRSKNEAKRNSNYMSCRNTKIVKSGTISSHPFVCQ